MTEKNSLNLGLVFGDIMLLSAFAEQIGADLRKLTRQARRCDALNDAGGVFYIDVPLFLEKNKELQAMDKEKRAAQKSDSSSRVTIETTTSPGILRGQLTRLTRLNAEHEKELEELPREMSAEADPDRKRKLKERKDNLPVMISSNEETLEKVVKRMKELGLEADTENANPEADSED
ncbi:MAG: hypothetical protein ACW98W_17805 [Candidatus Hodarchaeales archaeon]|jgi:vacuolar-type H+-ATPase subunit I/STV1